MLRESMCALQQSLKESTESADLLRTERDALRESLKEAEDRAEQLQGEYDVLLQTLDETLTRADRHTPLTPATTTWQQLGYPKEMQGLSKTALQRVRRLSALLQASTTGINEHSSLSTSLSTLSTSVVSEPPCVE